MFEEKKKSISADIEVQGYYKNYIIATDEYDNIYLVEGDANLASVDEVIELEQLKPLNSFSKEIQDAVLKMKEGD